MTIPLPHDLSTKKQHTDIEEQSLPIRGFKEILAACTTEEKPSDDEEGPFGLVEGCVPSPFSIATPTVINALPSMTTPDLQPLFESMATTMMVMNMGDETHTTLVLNHPSFAASPFFGTEITIKEFTTAPKTFNIEIISNPSAILAIQKGTEQLLSLFTRGDFGFSVHRLETHIQSDSPSAFEDSPEQQPQDEDEEP